MENNILVLGNGFDLYHNLKTKYYDFVQFACKIENQKDGDDRIKNICKENSFIQYFKRICDANNNWIDCEKEIENVVHTLQKIIVGYEASSDGKIYLNNIGGTVQDRIILMCIMGKYVVLKSDYYEIHYDYVKDGAFNKKDLLNDIRKELNEVIKVLSVYLKKEENEMKMVRYKQIEEITPKQVINFNYTNTYTKIYSNSVPVFYQHGNLFDSSKMVLGIPDSENISLDFIYFKKFFQRIQKRSGTIQSIPFKEYEGINESYPTLYFLGLSMGRTDGDIIKRMISQSAKAIIFYYDQDDYESKVINLIDIYGKDQVEEMVERKSIEFVWLDKKQSNG